MTIAFRSAATKLGHNAGSIVVDAPAGVISGDVLLAALVLRSPLPTVTLPSGWSHVLTTDAGSEYRQYVAVKVAGGAEPASYTFGLAGDADLANAMIVAYSGVDNTDPVDVSAGTAQALTSGTSIVAPSVTSTRDSGRAVAILGIGLGSPVTLSTPSGTTKRADVTGSSIAASAILVDYAHAPAGATGTKTSTASQSDTERVGQHLVLKIANRRPLAPTTEFPPSVNKDATNRFSWVHNDQDGDDQQGYQLRYRVQGTATWTTVTAESPNPWRDIAAGTFAAGLYEGQVRTQDAGGYGEWSETAQWEALAAPDGPAIIDPTVGETISTDERAVTYSAAEQDEREWRVLSDLAGAPDDTNILAGPTSEVTSISRTFTVNYAAFDGMTVHTQVRVKRSGLWSEWGTVSNPVSLTLPATPTANVDDEASAGALVVWADHPAPTGDQPVVTSINIRRREADDTGDGIRIAAELPPTTIFPDATVASGVAYAYQIEAVGMNGVSSRSAWTEEPSPAPTVIDGGDADTTVFDSTLDGGDA